MIIFSYYKLIKKIVKAKYKVAKLITLKKIPFRPKIFRKTCVGDRKIFLFIPL